MRTRAAIATSFATILTRLSRRVVNSALVSGWSLGMASRAMQHQRTRLHRGLFHMSLTVQGFFAFTKNGNLPEFSIFEGDIRQTGARIRS
jgi:hypothetical protein